MLGVDTVFLINKWISDFLIISHRLWHEDLNYMQVISSKIAPPTYTNAYSGHETFLPVNLSLAQCKRTLYTLILFSCHGPTTNSTDNAIP